MLFNSTYEENLKRTQARREIGTISFEGGYFDFNSFDKEVTKAAAKAKIDKSKVQSYKEPYRIYEDVEERFILYYVADETDEEYNKRIEGYKVKDLKEFIDVISKYNHAIHLKDKIKDLYNELCINGKYKGLAADWQKEQINRFFNEKDVNELVKEAYEKGLKEGENKLNKYKEDLKKMVN